MEPLQWCRQRLLVAGNPLTATLPFAATEHRDAILSLRSVISEIAAGTGGVSEPEPGLARLEWWRQALREDNPHPAVRALSETGARDRFEPAAFDLLIDGVSESLTNPRFESMTSAWQFFERVGGQAGVLEARVLEDQGDHSEAFRQIGACGYLIRAVRDLAIDARANRWLVPLDLQSDFQVSRQDAIGQASGPAFDGMVRAMLAEGIKKAESAIDQLDAGPAWRHRHQILQWSLEYRLARLLARKPQRILLERVLPGHAGNVWCVWRQARQLRRRLKT